MKYVQFEGTSIDIYRLLYRTMLSMVDNHDEFKLVTYIYTYLIYHLMNFLQCLLLIIIKYHFPKSVRLNPLNQLNF